MFSMGFYIALAAGKSYEDAFQSGKVAIKTKYPDEEQHLIPAIFSRQRNNPNSEKEQELYREYKPELREIDQDSTISKSLKEWCFVSFHFRGTLLQSFICLSRSTSKGFVFANHLNAFSLDFRLAV